MYVPRILEMFNVYLENSKNGVHIRLYELLNISSIEYQDFKEML